MAEIVPALLVKTREELIEKIRTVEPYVQRIHLDIADGIFVDNTTIDGFEDIESINTTLAIGVHLMVSKPENHIVRWLETPAESFAFHVEATNQSQAVINHIKEAEKMVGMVLNPETDYQIIAPFIDQLDFVQFMTVNPGGYGSPFVPKVIQKIKDFHYFYPDKPIVADGGINPDTARALITAGAQILVVGSYIFDHVDIKEAFESFKEI